MSYDSLKKKVLLFCLILSNSARPALHLGSTMDSATQAAFADLGIKNGIRAALSLFFWGCQHSLGGAKELGKEGFLFVEKCLIC